MKRLLLALIIMCGSVFATESFTAHLQWSIQPITSWNSISSAEFGDYIVIIGSREGVNSVPRYQYNHNSGGWDYIGDDLYPYKDDGLEIFDGSGNFITSYDFPEQSGYISYLTSITDSSFLINFNGIHICSLSNQTLSVVEVTQETLPLTIYGEITPALRNGIILEDSGYVTKISVSNLLSSASLEGSISSGFSQDNFVLNWGTLSGAEYQIQSSTDLTNWVNVGNAIVGTGESMTWANHITNSQAFYRVIED